MADCQPPSITRVAAVDPADPQLELVEQPSVANACATNDECFVSGCAQYACSAVPVLADACSDAPAFAPIGATCGCVSGACIWWRPSNYADEGASGAPCTPEGRCIWPLRCVPHSRGGTMCMQ